MSAQAMLGNLPPSIKAVVEKASSGDSYFGRTEKDKGEVVQWTTKVSQGAVTTEEGLKSLETTLTSRTFLVGNDLTAADVAVYSALHPVLSKRTPEAYYAQPSLTRYFDHIQHLPSVSSASLAVGGNLGPVMFDLDHMPPIERAAPPAKEKKPKPAAPAEASTTAPAPAAPAAKEPKPAAAPAEEAPVSKKEKKPKQPKEPKEEGAAGGKGWTKGQKAAPPAAAPGTDENVPLPSMIDLRVGHIISVERHPDADSLYVEKIDVGEAEPRTVCSGLVHYIPIEEVKDRDVIVVCNLKPVTMRGVKSFAMLLCATSPEGKDAGIEFVLPPPGSKPGERIYFDHPQYSTYPPLAQLNPKKKVWEAIQPGFTTLDTLEAAWVDKETGEVCRITTKEGVCKAQKFVGASLS